MVAPAQRMLFSCACLHACEHQARVEIYLPSSNDDIIVHGID